MLTPLQLRENARQNLADARALLPSSPRNAAYLAGYAVEFMLKARYCVLRKWPRFPSSAQELIGWNKRDGVAMQDKLFIHDLETLLRLSDMVYLKSSSFHRIDWTRATDWSEQLRYEPAGTISTDEAEELISEIEKLVSELNVFEVLQSLWATEIDLSAQYGPFHCFSFVKHPKTSKWVVLASWYARTQEEWDGRMTALAKKIDDALDSDLRTLVSSVEVIDPHHPVLQGLYVMLSAFGGGIMHSPRSLVARNIVVGYPMFPDGFVITAGNWQSESLEKSWNTATAIATKQP